MVSAPASKTSSPAQLVLAVVLQVRDGRLQVLLWERALEPFAGAWSLPGGQLGPGETLEQSIRRHLAAKVDVRELAHLEQLETRSDPDRNPLRWELATAYLGLVPSDQRPGPPATTRAGIRSTSCRRSRSTTARSCSPGASGCGRSSRTRTSASRSRRERFTISRAARPLPRGARARRLGDEPAARARSAAHVLEPTGRQRASRADGRPARRALPLPHAGRSRSRTSSRCCARLRASELWTSFQAPGSAAAAR